MVRKGEEEEGEKEKGGVRMILLQQSKAMPTTTTHHLVLKIAVYRFLLSLLRLQHTFSSSRVAVVATRSLSPSRIRATSIHMNLRRGTCSHHHNHSGRRSGSYISSSRGGRRRRKVRPIEVSESLTGCLRIHLQLKMDPYSSGYHCRTAISIPLPPLLLMKLLGL